MIQRSKEEILAKFEQVFGLEMRSSRDPGIRLERHEKNRVEVRVAQMYDPPPLTLKELIDLAEFFGTKNINDDRFSLGGCETCDYGSEYGFTLIIQPEGK